MSTMPFGTLHEAGNLIANRYLIQRYLGAGGMQEVYEATDQLLQRNVALKIPKNDSALKRFKRSAIVSARVNHANVAKTLDYIEAESRSYLIEELIIGKDFSKILKEHYEALDPMRAAFVLHRMAKGLAASHHAGVIHRDLKPSNVMSVGGELIDDVKITDFGIARMAEAELDKALEGGEETITASATAIGALPYMAPEMIEEGMKSVDRPADIWSLGCMMFELLTGRKPFGVGIRAVLVAIRSGKIPPLPNMFKAQFQPLAQEIYEILKLCIQIDPNSRPKADDLVRMCESLCYPISKRELGKVDRLNNSFWGFIGADSGNSVFFHRDSISSSASVAVGERVLFSRYTGGGSDRAFPVVKLKSPNK